MKVRDLLKKYHKLVPFPWTPAKIKKAGYDTAFFLVEMGRELENCEDKDSESAKQILEMLKDLEMLS